MLSAALTGFPNLKCPLTRRKMKKFSYPPFQVRVEMRARSAGSTRSSENVIGTIFWRESVIICSPT